MSLTLIHERLAPPAAGHAWTYAVQTRSELRLPGYHLTQQQAALIRLTVLETAPEGSLLKLVTLEVRTSATTFPASLLLDVARQQSPLLLRTDATGALQRITNKAALAAQWQEVLPWLQAKYRAHPEAQALLAQVGDQYCDDHNQLEQGLGYRGPWAALLPGCWGLHSWQGDTRTDSKTVPQALGPVALPLAVTWTAEPVADVFAPSVQVQGLGRLERARFDERAAQAYLRTLRGPVWTGPPAPLQVFWRAHYTVDRRSQGLLAGRQSMRLAVDKLYFADSTHLVRPATSLASF